MKKILMTLGLVSLLLSSCVEEMSIPDVTNIGYRNGNYIYDQINYTISAVEISKAVTMWQNATNEEERYLIEDLLFPNNKVRSLSPDTVCVIGFCTAIYKELATGDSVWEIIPYNQNNEVNCIYYVANLGNDTISSIKVGAYGDTLVQLKSYPSAISSKYIIEGSGKDVSLNGGTYFNKANFSITKGLVCNNYQGAVNWNILNQNNITSGVIELEIYLNDTLIPEDQTSVTFNNSYILITFRGESCRYRTYSNRNYYYNDYYY